MRKGEVGIWEHGWEIAYGDYAFNYKDISQDALIS